MAFIIIGVLLIACHLLGLGPMGAWNWELTGDLWKFALPFALALAWWAWSDASGLTKRRAMNRDEQRKQDRRDRSIEAMGLGHLQRNRNGKRK